MAVGRAWVSEDQGLPRLHSKFKVRLSNTRQCLKNKEINLYGCRFACNFIFSFLFFSSPFWFSFCFVFISKIGSHMTLARIQFTIAYWPQLSSVAILDISSWKSQLLFLVCTPGNVLCHIDDNILCSGLLSLWPSLPSTSTWPGSPEAMNTTGVSGAVCPERKLIVYFLYLDQL